MSSINESHTIHIHQILFGGMLLFLGYSAVRSLMGGSSQRFIYVVILIAVTAVVLLLDNRFWILLPVVYISRLRLPWWILRTELVELASVVVIGAYLLRLTMRREKPIQFRMAMLPAIPFLLWVLLVWAQNPSSLSLFGSETFGARYYLNILLGYAVLFVFSQLEVKEEDCKFLFRGAVIAFALGLLQAQIRALGRVSDVNYHLDVISYAILLMVCRYPLRDLLSLTWRFPVMLAMLAMVVFSGRRTGFGAAVLGPLLRMIYTGKEKLLTLFLGGLLVCVLLLAIAGDGVIYELPFTVRRTLSTIYNKYDDVRLEGRDDAFREIMYEHAKSTIRGDPWMGAGGFAIGYEQFASGFMGRSQFSNFAYVKNWHTLWLGLGADFGIPAIVFYALFSVYLVWFAFKAIRASDMNSYSGCLMLFFISRYSIRLIFSHNFGHSALIPYEMLICYGIALAIYNGQKAERNRELAASEKLLVPGNELAP